MTRYLADSSIWAWVQNGTRPDVDAKLADRLQRGEVATAPPIVLEVMHRARSAAEYEAIFETLLAPLDWLPLTEQASERAVDVQRQLAATTHGNHRRPAVDYLIAATAETTGNDIVLWFFDDELRIICEHTGQPFDAEASTGQRR